LGVLTFERSQVCVDLCLGLFSAAFRRSYLGTQTFFLVEFRREGRFNCPLHFGRSRLAFGVGTVEIRLFECSQPNFVTFGYGKLGISLEIELLASGEHILRLVVVGRLDELNPYLAKWLSWVFVSCSKSGTRSMVLNGDLIWVLGLVIWVITKQFGGLVGDHGGDGGVTHSGLRYQLPSPTSSVVEGDEVIVNTSLSYYRLILRPHRFGIWTGVLGP
jgi:hypothetical protein